MHTLPLMMLALAAPAKVSSVVVYPDRALVTRVETVACTGRPLAVFESVPPAADPSSFRARSEDATVESLVIAEPIEETPIRGLRMPVRIMRLLRLCKPADHAADTPQAAPQPRLSST